MEEYQAVKLARRGDQEAFAWLVERYKDRVFHTALRMVGNSEDALDVTQDVFVKVWLRLYSLRRGASFQAWLYRIAANTILDYLRSRKRLKECEVHDQRVIDLLAIQRSPNPRNLLEAKMLRRSRLLSILTIV